MKLIKRLVLLIVILLVVGGVVLYFTVNGMIRTAIEIQASSQLKLDTTLGAASLKLLGGGSFSMTDLQIGSPAGFSAPRMFTLQSTDVKVGYARLRRNPVVIDSVVINRPRLVIEQKDGTFNFRKVMQDLQEKGGEGTGDSPPKPSEPQGPEGKKALKVIIAQLDVKGAEVVLRPGLPGLDKEMVVPLPDIRLQNVGGDDPQGSGLMPVVMQLIGSMAGKTMDVGNLPDALKGAIQANVKQMADQLGAEVQKQLSLVSENLNEAISKPLQDVQKNTESGVGDVQRNIEGQLGDLLGGRRPATRPGH